MTTSPIWVPLVQSVATQFWLTGVAVDVVGHVVITIEYLIEPSRCGKQIVGSSWTAHLRRYNQATAADLALRERRLAFGAGEGPPAVKRYIARH